MKKVLSIILSALLVLSLLAFQPVAQVQAEPTEAESVAVQDGVTLHCWNWSFKEIQDNMATIAALGYTAIQTSPIQQAKQATLNFPTNDWWVYYQPAAFQIDNTGDSALGNKADFQAMCKTAHEYGIKVIVDVVANHMGNTETGTNGLAPTIAEELSNDPDCWHDIYKNTTNYGSRLEVTQYCMTGLPDLNTSNKKVQNMVLDYLKECIDAGADGFRFDAAKHIETPEDGDLASDFWPTVINGAKDYALSSRDIDLYCYGELLDSPGGTITESAYTKYMSITDNTWSTSVLTAASGNAGAFGGIYHKGTASQLVLWAESHDTYADETTRDVSEENVNKAWALVAAREGAMGLYLARPANFSQLLGAASNTAWAYPEVAAANKFHTAFIGQSEYVANEGNIAYVERGTAGVVLVNCGGTEAEVSVTANQIADGTYTDQITGNAFTVSGGKISGKIGSTGIAVVYECQACDHATHDHEGFCTSCNALVGHDYDENRTCACGDTLVSDRTIYFVNSIMWSKVNYYSWYDDINIITDTWPGNPMTLVEGNIYSCVIPSDAPNIIFNDTYGIQTENLTLPEESSGLNMYDLATKEWVTYGEQKPDEEKVTNQPEPAAPEEPSDMTMWIVLAVCAVVVVAAVVVIIVVLKKDKK